MKPEITYELWKNSVIKAARALRKAADDVGVNGIEAIDAYNAAHRALWEAFEREPRK